MADKTWIYRVYDQKTTPELFGAFTPMVDLWRSKFIGELLPTWKDFELQDFEGWYGQISLGQMTYNPTELTFLLWGTKLTEWWGKDKTGKALSHDSKELYGNWEEIERPYILSLIETLGIGLCQGDLDAHDREFIRQTYIGLPLVYEGEVSRILSIYSNTAQLDHLQGVSPLYEFIEHY